MASHAARACTMASPATWGMACEINGMRGAGEHGSLYTQPVMAYSSHLPLFLVLLIVIQYTRFLPLSAYALMSYSPSTCNP